MDKFTLRINDKHCYLVEFTLTVGKAQLIPKTRSACWHLGTADNAPRWLNKLEKGGFIGVTPNAEEKRQEYATVLLETSCFEEIKSFFNPKPEEEEYDG